MLCIVTLKTKVALSQVKNLLDSMMIPKICLVVFSYREEFLMLFERFACTLMCEIHLEVLKVHNVIVNNLQLHFFFILNNP